MDLSTTAGDPPTSAGDCCATAPEFMFCEDGWFPVALTNTNADAQLTGCPNAGDI